MYIWHIILAISSSIYQTLLKLMKILRSSNRNNFTHVFLLRHGIYIYIYTYIHIYIYIYTYNMRVYSYEIYLLSQLEQSLLMIT